MFCEEKIFAAYRGTREYEDIDGANSFFDYYHDLAFHVTEGERIALETESYFISIDVYGISKHAKSATIKEFEHEGEWLDP